jgi:transposase
MRQKSGPQGRSNSIDAEQHIKDIRHATQKRYSTEEKIRVVLSGLRGEYSIAELCQREGIAESLCPSSNNLGRLSVFANGGSGSSWVPV